MEQLRKQMALTCVLLFTLFMYAQETERPEYVVVSKAHWNWDNEEGSYEDWLAMEKEFHENVIMKNDHILSAGVLMHRYTDDNSEVLFYTTYRSWSDIETAQSKNEELMEAAWPDEAKRTEYNNKRNRYYSPYHSDEIYRTVPGIKELTTPPSNDMIVYVRIDEMAFPEDGDQEEYMALRKEWMNATVHKNEKVLGHYESRHAWGANGTDYLTFQVYNSFADLESAADRNQELVEAKWSTEESREAFFEKFNRYFTPQHRDYLYSFESGLMKSPPQLNAENE